MTRISIVIPSFNQGQYLEQAIQSVLAQNYAGTELIVIDGASTDNSADILRKYASSLAYWESTPDRGQAHAINKGFAHCTGDVITFLSSDDYYLPGTFRDVAETLHHHPTAGAIVGAFSFLDAEHAQPNEPILPFLGVPSPADLSLGPPGVYRLHQAATFYTRHALDAVGRHVREDMKYVMDRELLYRVCKQYPILLSKRTYGVFRKHSDSKSISQVIPFAREFADLYLLNRSGNKTQDKQRQMMARYRLSRGYMKHARAADTRFSAFQSMLRAGLVYPSNFLQKGYWKIFLGRD
jgi:glycosyltransferase involved in cell wall biosynthesis